jgi:signal transduction histidine kinase
MPGRVRLLIVEDSPDDADLVVRELHRAGFAIDHRRVDTPAAFRNALEERSWDVVVCDYSLPSWSALDAFADLKEAALDIPFIIVSGSIGEETAVKAMRAGVQDYLLKDDLSRLVPAVERELRELENRSDKRRVEEQLLLSERMAVVGTLAAGLAHELNNPLAVVLANLELLSEDVAGLAAEIAVSRTGMAPAGSVERFSSFVSGSTEILRDCREAGDRMRRILRDLKVFARTDDARRGPVDVEHVLETTLRLASNELRHRANVVKELGGVPPVDANEALLGQLFLNLLLAAAQRIPEHDASKQEIRVRTMREHDGRIAIEISDTGPSLRDRPLANVFQPYASAHAIDSGTGLGLPIAHRIVTRLGGEIGIKSGPGEPNVLRVLLPPAKEAQPERAKTPVASSKPAKSANPENPANPVGPANPASPAEAKKRARVLVIDDEHMVSTSLARMLGTRYTVTAVDGGREALDLLATEPEFDVILCDLMMPEMSGMDFFAELGKTFPALVPRVIFLTGGAFTTGATEFLSRLKNPCLDKPVELKKLIGTIEEQLS